MSSGGDAASSTTSTTSLQLDPNLLWSREAILALANNDIKHIRQAFRLPNADINACVEGPCFDPFRKSQRLGRQLQEIPLVRGRGRGRGRGCVVCSIASCHSTHHHHHHRHRPVWCWPLPSPQGETHFGRPQFCVGDTLLDLAIRNHKPEAVKQQIRHLGGRSVNFKDMER